MKKIYFIITVQFLFLVTTCKAQYKLEPAFPNLSNFAYPVEMVNANDGSNRLFVVQQKGRIIVFNNSPNVSVKKTFIDLTSRVSQNFVTGIFGLAFHPDYKNNRYFYTHFVYDSAGSPSGRWLRITRFTASATNPDTVQSNSEKFMLKAPLPGSFHNGGKIAFGPDGYLYISFGDGYSGGAPAQDRTSLLGKILRINVDSTSPGKNYSIPASNPYKGNSLGYREEIYAYGLRNTWKFSFDFPTNTLWSGDVGESSYEEINLIENGRNYGWNKMEGSQCYGPCDTTGREFTNPFFEYPHSVGTAIIGGYVYRGSLLPDLYGKYIFGDEIPAKVWALNDDGVNPITTTTLIDTTFDMATFGTDENNEIYVCSYNATTGRIFKIVNTSVITVNLKMAIQGFYDPSLNALRMKDTVRVYLHSSVSPYPVIDSATTLIDSLTLSGLCFFKNSLTDNYYIRVNHRNSIETWSKSGGEYMATGGIVNFDFTDSVTKAFGNNLAQINTSPEKFAVYSGDVDRDGFVTALDFTEIYNEALVFAAGYNNSDLTGDNISDSYDVIIAYNNSINFVKTEKPK